MSKVLERSFGGFFNSLIGSISPVGSTTTTDSNTFPGFYSVSLGLINYVERLEAARKISKQEEEDVISQEYEEWLRLASCQTKNEITADNLCRSLIAFCRGHYFPNLHINAIKLTQSEKMLQKKMGYLYISRTMPPGSDLIVLLVNTIQRDLSSANMIQISLGLSLLPVVISVDISSTLSNSLIVCLNHQQPYIRRRAALMASAFTSLKIDGESALTLLLPYLLHLLADKDPATAIAATMTLAHAYNDCGSLCESEFKDDVARASAHILVQATSGALPQHYNIGPINAPFIQVQMLRNLRRLSSMDWAVPEEVFGAVDAVLSQPWGGRNLTLYMTLLEGVTTATALPRHEALISQSLKIVLGFLKSSSVDFKYLGIKALASVLVALEDTITEAHLEAVLDCLNSSSRLLQRKTISLLCSMANKLNYQAICVTLMEFSKKCDNRLTRDFVRKSLAQLLKAVCCDVPWSVAFLSPILEDDDDERFLVALRIIIRKNVAANMKEKEEEVITACHKLLRILLRAEATSGLKLSTAASIMNDLFTVRFESIDSSIAADFIDKIDCKTDMDKSILKCLLNCGLHNADVIDKVQSTLRDVCKGSTNCSRKQSESCLESAENLLLLRNPKLTKTVMERQQQLLEGSGPLPDLSLSFHDAFVVKSLGNGAQPPYKPFTIKTRSFSKERRPGSFNPFDAKEAASSTTAPDTLSISTSGSVRSSVAGLANEIGTSPRQKTVWTSRGRLKPETGTGDAGSLVSSGCVEIAKEVEEDSVFDLDDHKSISSSFLEGQRADLTQALLKGLGLST